MRAIVDSPFPREVERGCGVDVPNTLLKFELAVCGIIAVMVSLGCCIKPLTSGSSKKKLIRGGSM